MMLASPPLPLFPPHYLYLSLSLICWASSYPWLSSSFELGSCHSFPQNSEAADSVPQDIAFRHLPLALPLMVFAHRVRWYQLFWEAFFILQLLHLTPLSATLCIPCDVLWRSLSSEMDLWQADPSPFYMGLITSKVPLFGIFGASNKTKTTKQSRFKSQQSFDGLW